MRGDRRRWNTLHLSPKTCIFTALSASPVTQIWRWSVLESLEENEISVASNYLMTSSSLATPVLSRPVRSSARSLQANPELRSIGRTKDNCDRFPGCLAGWTTNTIPADKTWEGVSEQASIIVGHRGLKNTAGVLKSAVESSTGFCKEMFGTIVVWQGIPPEELRRTLEPVTAQTVTEFSPNTGDPAGVARS